MICAYYSADKNQSDCVNSPIPFKINFLSLVYHSNNFRICFIQCCRLATGLVIIIRSQLEDKPNYLFVIFDILCSIFDSVVNHHYHPYYFASFVEDPC